VELPSDDQLGETCLVEPVFESAGETMIKARLRTALGRLAGRQREVLMQHYMQGKSYREIGLSLNCKENTVRSRLQKARARMRKEMDIMNKDMKSKNVIALDRQALQAIIAAAKARNRSENHPTKAILGVLLENSGRVVGTDGRHIVIRECAALRNLTENVLLLPPESLEKLDLQSATLVVGISEALLHVEGSADLQIPVLDEKYPDYLQVFPATWRYSLSMPFGKLRAMSEKMLPYLPEMEVCNGAPIAKFIFSVPEQELSIRIISSTGGNVKTGKEEDFPIMHSTSLKGEIRTNGQVDDVIALTMNYQYFMNGICGLCLSDDEAAEIRLIDGKNPVVVSSGRKDSISAIMPMAEK
jgi:DNA-binding CsgD family transcriptional regulator